MGEGTAQRPAVSHLYVADGGSRLGEGAASPLNRGGRLDFGVGRHRADCNAVLRFADAREALDTGDIDEDPGVGEPRLHHGQEAMASGEDSRVVSMLSELRESVF